jgi:hypothetical protein
MKTYLMMKTATFRFLFMFLLILVGVCFLPQGKAALQLGEGTGHQRVVELIGKNIQPQKIFFNDNGLVLRRKIDSLEMNAVAWMILQNEQVVSSQQIRKMNFDGPKTNFAHLSQIIIPEGAIQKDDIWVLITK